MLETERLSFIATCPAQYCSNGGTCRMNGLTPVCDCVAPYSGPSCDTVTNTPAPGLPSLIVRTRLIINQCCSEPLCTKSVSKWWCVSARCGNVSMRLPRHMDWSALRNSRHCSNHTEPYASADSGSWYDADSKEQRSASFLVVISLSLAVNCFVSGCANGGTCYNINPGTICICPYPWGGSRCTDNTLTGPVGTPAPTNPPATNTPAPGRLNQE
jgi:hypothetical protein